LTRPLSSASGGGKARRKRVLLLLQYYDHRHHAGVARYAAAAGWALEDAYTHLRTIPPSWEGDGIISFHGPSQEFVDWLKGAKVPVVDMGEEQGLSDFPRVMTDHEAIARLAVEHFAERNFKSVGFVWAWDTVVKQRRLEAFRAEADRRGLRFVECSLEQVAGLAAARAFPIGLLAATDATAVRALRACEDAGVLVPEQAALMGVDNFE
jgi:DNA-binding LacI/PurR family transcriptional regulator